jgi:GNAT superfamily N-acetyltransferase
MYLEDLIVTESMRGNGIGMLLFKELIATCKEKNLKGMNWQVLDWNLPAINFYKKLPGVKLDPEWVNGILDFT